jgi:hypothetical protein
MPKNPVLGWEGKFAHQPFENLNTHIILDRLVVQHRADFQHDLKTTFF